MNNATETDAKDWRGSTSQRHWSISEPAHTVAKGQTVSIALAEHLFRFLELCAIPYVVVGDTRQYPHQVESDVDIVLGCSDFRGFTRALLRHCSAHELKCLQAIQHEDSCWYFVISATTQKKQTVFLHPDVCGDYQRNGRVFLKAEELLSGRRQILPSDQRTMVFSIPAPAQAFIYYLLKKIDKQQITLIQGDYLSGQWREDPVGALAQLTRFWAESDVVQLAQAAERNVWAPVVPFLPALQRTLRRRLPVTIMARLRDLRRVGSRLKYPTGLHLVFLGPDGVGKSTVIKRVERDLSPAFRRTKRYHLRPFFGRRERDGAPVTNPHDQALRGPLSSLAKLAWWWLDYTVGYLIDIFPRIRCSTLVLFDRYYHDLLVDQKRYRYGGPLWLARFAGRCIPSPDLVIVLDAPADIVHMRKQEVPPSELTRQRSAYRSVLKTIDCGHVIDASQSLEQVVFEVETLIVRHLEQRLAARFEVTAAPQ